MACFLEVNKRIFNRPYFSISVTEAVYLFCPLLLWYKN